MRVGDRVRVTHKYGDRFPYWSDYVGAEGDVVETSTALPPGWIMVRLDRDHNDDLFASDEIEVVQEF